MSRMAQIMETRQATRLTDDEFQDVLHFYFTFSPETQPPLGEDPDPRESPLRFEKIVLGNPASADPRDPPFLGHVQVTDLDQDGRRDVLVCDSEKSAVNWIHEQNGVWKEETLGAKFEILELGQLWDAAFLKARPEIAAARLNDAGTGFEPLNTIAGPLDLRNHITGV